MSTTVERAAAGRKKAMTTLYKQYKDELYSFCCILLNDKQKASFAAANVMNEVWGKLPTKSIDGEDEFRHLLFGGAAKHCRLLLFHGDSRGFKVNKTTHIEAASASDENYTGEASIGITALQTALSRIDPHQRYVYLLHIAGGLSFKEIGHIVKQRDTVAKYCYEAAAAALSRNLSGELRMCHVKSLLKQALGSEILPKSVEVSCLRQIKACAKRHTPSKRVWASAICVVLLTAGVISAVLLMPTVADNDTGDDAYASAEAESNTSDTDTAYAPAELDAELTYYADIEIQDYGTVTIELNQESAPITAANFVALAEDGFYDGLTFHRIIEGFMMQGGDPNGDGTGGSENTIVGEFTDNGYENDLSHTRGAVSMARSSDYDSASSQFFIVQQDSTSLDGQYAVFGYVTDGMDIVDSICEAAEPTDDNGTIEAQSQPVIQSITIRTE